MPVLWIMADARGAHRQLVEIHAVYSNFPGHIGRGILQLFHPPCASGALHGKAQIIRSVLLRKDGAVLPQHAVFRNKLLEVAVFCVGQPGIDVKADVAPACSHMLHLCSQLILCAQLRIRLIFREAVVKAILVPARKKEMVEPQRLRFLKQPLNFIEPVDNAAILIFKVVVCHQSGAFLKPVRAGG